MFVQHFCEALTHQNIHYVRFKLDIFWGDHHSAVKAANGTKGAKSRMVFALGCLFISVYK